MTERTKSWLPWIAVVLNVGLLVVGFTTSYAKQGSQGEATLKAVSELKGSIDSQKEKLDKINELINDLKKDSAVASRDLLAQNDKLRELQGRIATVEARLQQQGERLARRGI